ncbi:Rhamnolipids biosynthesis 3-oxoacyl-[acyl-carrier-protein] reductase [Methylobacterium bullatum]|uniref:Rhamnolipids biosynthesis 3-oxoacyl-[acyl-carrier-protein] reductase n=1 Tax=Methylobacterium bullatum TaxID=570505 RepID=A0A679J904_9HYPH|nr:Rhamnolipids biosynthesis 3-oxoacyl-[acyl-carrier-protein] reductase [Methylobacterium bullatum]
MANAAPIPGKICLVTGATSGIGYETALGLARAGARVGIVGRDAGRTDEAASRIRGAVPGAVIDVFLADLSSQAEIRRLAAEVRALYPRLDVLVNNAGAIFDTQHLTVDGLERTWALDHLAYMQLTLDLLELMKASAPARIVNVASMAHKRGRIDLEDIDGARRYGALKAYSQAKLGNVLFTAALARRLAGTGVTVNSLHPGVIASGFAGGTGGWFGFGWSLIRPFLRNPADGAATSLHLATSPEVDGVTGLYFSKRRPVPTSSLGRDEALQERVWALSLRQLGRAE